MKVNASDIKMVKVEDYDPDLSYLGTWSDTPKEGAIDHKARTGDRNAYRYFNPENPEYAEQEYKRAMDFENGWLMCYGVKAEIILNIPAPYGENHWIIQAINSPGLWGIESDSDDSYFEEVFEQEKRTLIHMLEAMGIEVVEETENA